MHIHIEPKKGQKLTNEELFIINRARKIEFNSSTLISPQPDNDDWQKMYFLLKDANNELLSFGRVHDLEIKFLTKMHRILGIAMIISLHKHQGYGRKLIIGMKEYIKQTGITAIGFCNKATSSFYKKSGCQIIENGVERFLYKDENGKLNSDLHGGGDVLYIEGNDNLINDIIQNPNEVVTIFRPHW